MKKQVFGAILLSAALAVGTCMPAFAADAPAASGDKVVTPTEDSTGATTAVKVTTTISQINVALPLALPIVADQGGGDATTPTNYYIENLTASKIKVSGVSWSITDDQKDNWNLGAAKLAKNSNAVSYGTSDGKTGTPKNGSLYMTLEYNSAADTGATTNGNESGRQVKIMGSTDNTLSGATTTAVNWVIGKATTTNKTMGSGIKFPLTVEASSSNIAEAVGTATDVINVVYTIEAA